MRNSRRKLSVEPRPQMNQFSFNVAFTTQDRQHVDQHFGTAKCVLVYGIGPENHALLEAIEYRDVDENRHEKLPLRIHDLEVLDCAAIYCNACGVSAIKQLLEGGVNPVKVQVGLSIRSLITELQKELVGEPTGWVKRVLKSKVQAKEPGFSQHQRLEQLMDEEW